MLPRSRSCQFVVPCTALALVLTLASHQAQAKVRPFQIVGAGVAPEGLPLPGQDPRPHWIVGVATGLGWHTGQGTVKTDTAAFQPVGHITGEFGSGSPFVFTGANGNQLVCNYGRTDLGAEKPGTFDLTILGFTPKGAPIVEALFIAEFVPDPTASTGKFKGVTGSWIMYAYTEPFVLGASDPIDYAWEGEGSLNFPEHATSPPGPTKKTTQDP